MRWAGQLRGWCGCGGNGHNHSTHTHTHTSLHCRRPGAKRARVHEGAGRGRHAASGAPAGHVPPHAAAGHALQCMPGMQVPGRPHTHMRGKEVPLQHHNIRPQTPSSPEHPTPPNPTHTGPGRRTRGAALGGGPHAAAVPRLRGGGPGAQRAGGVERRQGHARRDVQPGGLGRAPRRWPVRRARGVPPRHSRDGAQGHLHLARHPAAAGDAGHGSGLHVDWTEAKNIAFAGCRTPRGATSPRCALRPTQLAGMLHSHTAAPPESLSTKHTRTHAHPAHPHPPARLPTPRAHHPLTAPPPLPSQRANRHGQGRCACRVAVHPPEALPALEAWLLSKGQRRWPRTAAWPATSREGVKTRAYIRRSEFPALRDALRSPAAGLCVAEPMHVIEQHAGEVVHVPSGRAHQWENLVLSRRRRGTTTTAGTWAATRAHTARGTFWAQPGARLHGVRHGI